MGSGGKNCDAAFKGLCERAALVLFVPRPGLTLYHGLDHPSLRHDGCMLLSLTVRK